MKRILLLIIVFIGFVNLGYSQIATATSGSATSIGVTEATLNGNLNPNGSSCFSVGFEYDDDIAFGSSAIATPDQGGSIFVNTPLTYTLSGLSSNTTYYFRVVVGYSTSDAGPVTDASSSSFTTLAASTPTILTGTTGTVASASITVTSNSLTDDGGSAVSQHGLKAGTSSGTYTITTILGGTSSVPKTFDNMINDLTASTKYYFAAYATNSIGTAYGDEYSAYTTPSVSAAFISMSGFDVAENNKLTLNWDDGNGETGSGVGGRIIVAYSFANAGASPAPTAPTDGTVYSANPAFGSGSSIGSGYVVYAGNSGNSVQITNLLGATKDYKFFIYEYSGSADSEINYKVESPGFINTNGTTFPIELISFSAKSVNNRVDIDWSTATELNNDYFEIERSFDAVNFEVVVKVPGAGNSNNVLNYSIIDNEDLDGDVYYRLKQTDFDGAYTYSSILPVTIGGNNELQISDVINDNKSISFVYNNDISEKALIQLIDINGRIVKTEEVSGSGAQMVRMAMGNLSHGVYVIRLSVKDETIVKKLVY